MNALEIILIAPISIFEFCTIWIPGQDMHYMPSTDQLASDGVRQYFRSGGKLGEKLMGREQNVHISGDPESTGLP
jgi:hypothetical protein